MARLSSILQIHYTPRHNGNDALDDPYTVRLAPLSRGEYAELEACRASLVRDGLTPAESAASGAAWLEATEAALSHIVGVTGLFDDADQPVGRDAFVEIAGGVLELRWEIIGQLMARARVSEAEGKL